MGGCCEDRRHGTRLDEHTLRRPRAAGRPAHAGAAARGRRRARRGADRRGRGRRQDPAAAARRGAGGRGRGAGRRGALRRPRRDRPAVPAVRGGAVPAATRSTPRRSARSSPTVPRSRGCCPGPSGSAAAPDDQSNRLQLFDGLVEVLGAVGRPGHPLLLVLEDLHWADASSRDVLRFLVSRLRDQHLLVVASYRTDDLHRRHPWRPVATELSRHPRVERLDLSPFTDDELREFTTALSGSPLTESHAAPGHRPVRGQRVLRGGAPGGRRRGGRAAVVARRRPARPARAARPVGPAPGPHRVRGRAPGVRAARCAPRSPRTGTRS